MKEAFAFPQAPRGPLDPAPEGGLTKREVFAALAMHGMTTGVISYQREWTGQMTPAFIAEQSVKIADGLIKALEEKS